MTAATDATHADELAALKREVAAVRSELGAALESYKAFAYSVSHDLRAPLRAIVGFATMLEETAPGELTTDAPKYLDIIRDNAHAMSAQIDGLLGLSRLEHRELRRAVVDMTTVARRAADEVRALHAGHPMIATIHPLLAAVGDAGLLHIAFVELLKNAWKFTRDGPTPRVEVASEPADDGTVYRVSDNGVGFAPSAADRLFVIFRRLHAAKDYEGLGIGLATVKSVVSRHGGRVWAAAEPHGGATFRFSLPGD